MSEKGIIPNIFTGVSEISDNFVKQKFGDVGDLIQEYVCALVGFGPLSHQGNMYITSKFICFYCSIFAKERKVRIPFNKITNIARVNNALLFANAITITAESKTYTFKGFWKREEAYLKLASLLQDAKANNPQNQQQLPVNVRIQDPPKQIITPL